MYLLALLAACAPRLEVAPQPVGTVDVRVPGAPAGCTSAYVVSAGPAADPRAPFQQVPGVIRGIDWGACTWMGPLEGTGEGLWVLLAWRPEFRGDILCEGPAGRSPVFRVEDPSTPIPEGIKVRWYRETPGASLRRDPPFPVPDPMGPCPAGDPGWGVRPGGPYAPRG